MKSEECGLIAAYESPHVALVAEIGVYKKWQTFSTTGQPTLTPGRLPFMSRAAIRCGCSVAIGRLRSIASRRSTMHL
jgi:hypothetical protein